jgi:Carboxypeptidase regulatory-like domain
MNVAAPAHRTFLMRSLLVLSLAITASCAQTQSTDTSQTATISGTVVDQTGAIIPNATVSLGTADRPQFETTTDSNGHFVIEVAPREYSLKAKAPGFRLYMQAHLTVTGQTVEQIMLLVSNSGCGPCIYVGPPPLETLNVSLESLLPLTPLPPLQLSAKASKHPKK